MLSDVSREDVAGMAVGVFRFIGDLGFVLGPVVAGAAAATLGFGLAFAIAAAGTLGFGLAFAIAAVPAALAMGVALWAPETLGLAPSHCCLVSSVQWPAP
jgi:MFS family permease